MLPVPDTLPDVAVCNACASRVLPENPKSH